MGETNESSIASISGAECEDIRGIEGISLNANAIAVVIYDLAHDLRAIRCTDESIQTDR